MGAMVITSRHFSLLCIALDAPQPSCQHKEGSPVKAGVSAPTLHRPQVPPQGPAGAASRAAQVPAGLLLGAAQVAAGAAAGAAQVAAGGDQAAGGGSAAGAGGGAEEDGAGAGEGRAGHQGEAPRHRGQDAGQMRPPRAREGGYLFLSYRNNIFTTFGT